MLTVYRKAAEFQSRDTEGSCPRELFECDLQFAKDTLATKDVYNEDYHAFYGKSDWNSDEQCQPRGLKPNAHECCGGHDRNFIWMGTNNKKCCATADGNSGVVKNKDETC